MVRLEGNKVSTDLYGKPTDMRQYSDNGSGGSRHVKQEMPDGQALRVRKICDSEEVCDERFEEFSGDFIRRGFKRKFIESQFLKDRKKNRLERVSFFRKLERKLRRECLWLLTFIQLCRE